MTLYACNICMRGVLVSRVFRLHNLMAECAAELYRFSYVKGLKTSQSREKKNYDSGDGKNYKSISVPGIVKINLGEPGFSGNSLFSDPFPLSDHTDGDH